MPTIRADPRRLAAQLLAGPPAASAEDAVHRILAVQGQDPRGFRLAVRARTTGVTAADVDAALTERRSLVVSWLNRGTLHLVGAADFGWLHALTTPQLATSSARRLQQEGLTEAESGRGVDLIVQRIADAGPQTRPELRAALDGAGVRTAGQALVHLLLAASIRHRLIRGPVRDGEHAYALADDWLGPAEPVDPDEALARLGRRYLMGHGPADARDLAMWAGIRLGDARRAFDAISAETVRDADGLVDLADRPDPPPPPPPRLLGAFDPLLHGWVSRDAVLGPHTAAILTGGVFRPFALVEGRAVARWGVERGGVHLHPLEPLDAATLTALEHDAGDVLAFLGRPATPIRIEAGPA